MEKFQTMGDKYLLIDANSILYRIFFSTKKFISEGAKDIKENSSFFDRQGKPINILKNFVEIFLKYKTKTFCDYKIIVAFDHPERSTYRDKYSFYKSNRKKDEDYYSVFLPQYKLIINFLKLLNIKTYQSRNLEADDIIGIFAKALSSNKKNLIEIITSDKDLFQLIDDNVIVNLLVQGQKKFTKVTKKNMLDLVLNFENVNNYSINPKQIIDIKSLNGDNSDNISGLLIKDKANNNKIKKIKLEETIKLIDKHKSLEELIKFSEKNINGSNIYSQIANQKDKLLRNKKIIRILTNYKNIEIDKEFNNFSGSIRFRELYLFLDRYNLNSLIRIIKKRKSRLIYGCYSKNIYENQVYDKKYIN